MVWLLVFVSLIFELTSCQDTCDTLRPLDGCNLGIEPCIGRNRILLRCPVSSQSRASVQWYSVQELNSDGTIPLAETSANQDTARMTVNLSSENQGYWWCSSDNTTKKKNERCQTITALHLYPCTCNSITLTVFQRICPASRSPMICARQAQCRSGQSLLCLSTTQLSISPSTTEALSYETASASSTISTLLYQSETQLETQKTTLTPTSGHSSVTTTHTLLLPTPSSSPPTPPDGKKNETKANESSSNTVQLLLYIVGLLVGLIALSVVSMILCCILCLQYKKNKQKKNIRDRSQSKNSRRGGSMGSASWKEGPIYDIPSIRTHSNLVQPTNTVPEEYEVPVNKPRMVSKQENGGHSQSTSSVNPVSLELYSQGGQENAE